MDGRVELVFSTAAYVSANMVQELAGQSSAEPVVDEVVVRLNCSEAGARYHVPLVLSPHSCTLWWSEPLRPDNA